MASMGMWPWTASASFPGTTDSTKHAAAKTTHRTAHSDPKRTGSHTAVGTVLQADTSAPATSPSKERRAEALSKYKEKRRVRVG